MQRPRGPRFLPVRPDEEHRTNRQIRVPQVRLIGLHGEQLGIVSIRTGLELADKYELDLVEVAPQVKPPVCRIMDFSKYKYEQEKREREAKKHQKHFHLKEIRVKPNIEGNLDAWEYLKG